MQQCKSADSDSLTKNIAAALSTGGPGLQVLHLPVPPLDLPFRYYHLLT